MGQTDLPTAPAKVADLAVPDVAATMRWPGFRDSAYRLGTRASLSIPLFAGRGTAMAAINLYGRGPAALAPLTAAVWARYDPYDPGASPTHAAWIRAAKLWWPASWCAGHCGSATWWGSRDLRRFLTPGSSTPWDADHRLRTVAVGAPVASGAVV
jgi:hypothetical protein